MAVVGSGTRVVRMASLPSVKLAQKATWPASLRGEPAAAAVEVRASDKLLKTAHQNLS